MLRLQGFTIGISQSDWDRVFYLLKINEYECVTNIYREISFQNIISEFKTFKKFNELNFRVIQKDLGKEDSKEYYTFDESRIINDVSKMYSKYYDHGDFIATNKMDGTFLYSLIFSRYWIRINQ